MTPIAILGAPVPLPDYYVSGPYPPHQSTNVPVFTDAFQFADGIIGNVMPARDNNPSGRSIWTHVSNGAGGTQVQEFYKGIQARRMDSGAGAARVNNGLEGINLMPVLDATGLGAGFLNPSWRRVVNYKFGIALGAGSTPDEQTGVLLALEASGAFLGTDQWPTAPSVTFGGGFGIVGDGAGDWLWESYDGTVPPNAVSESVALSGFYSDAEEWNQFEIEIVSAAGGRAAVCELYINGALALTRNFVDDPAPTGLVQFGLAAAIENYKFVPIIQVGPLVAAPTVFFGDWQFTSGRFTRAGLELAE